MFLVAEKAFNNLRLLAEDYPSIMCIAVSHCTRKETDSWVEVIGGPGRVTLVVDDNRELYSQWGLGISNTWYLLNPWTQAESAKAPWGREMSGSRWQMGGTWAVDGRGVIKWGGMSKRADEMPALDQAIESLGVR